MFKKSKTHRFMLIIYAETIHWLVGLVSLALNVVTTALLTPYLYALSKHDLWPDREIPKIEKGTFNSICLFIF